MRRGWRSVLNNKSHHWEYRFWQIFLGSTSRKLSGAWLYNSASMADKSEMDFEKSITWGRCLGSFETASDHVLSNSCSFGIWNVLILLMCGFIQFKNASVVQTESRRIDSYAEVQPILADFQSAKITRISQIIYDYWDFNVEFNKIGNVSAGFAMKQYAKWSIMVSRFVTASFR